MKFFLGIDGGGTKTAFCLIDEFGKTIASYTTNGSSYREIGIDGVCEILSNGLTAILAISRVEKTDLLAAAFGAPCFGEDSILDEKLNTRVQELFYPTPIKVVNDVEIAAFGALASRPGIHIVSGTGSIAFGRDVNGNTKRCGGWDETFSDEGSCFWLGLRAISLFSKQADGRLPRAALYSIFQEHFSLKSDMDLIQIVHNELLLERSRIASLQMLLLQAAEQGDPSAVKAYKDAITELVLLIKGVRSSLPKLPSPCLVSYSGGLFNIGTRILSPFNAQLKKIDCALVKPAVQPWQGAALLAIDSFASSYLPSVIENMHIFSNSL